MALDGGEYVARAVQGCEKTWVLLPENLPTLASYTLLVLDSNVRAASLLGLVGAGGIGIGITTRLRLFDDASPPVPGGPHFSLTDIYQRILHRAAAELPSVLAIVTAAPGPVLIHCAAGKDRTGVLVALLLRSASVTREAVVADYRATVSTWAASTGACTIPPSTWPR